MLFLRSAVIVSALLCVSTLCFSQRYNSDTGSIIWDLGPDDPQVRIQFGTKGINIGGYEHVAPIVRNNFGDTLMIKIEFRITDLCGETKTYTTNSRTLKPNETWAPSPFFEGYDFNTACKKFAEFGPADKKTKTRIQRISHTVLTLKNITRENKAAREERARKAREQALKQQQEAEAKAKAEKERAEKQKAEKEKAEKEKAERERAEREKAEKAKAEQEQIAQQQAGRNGGQATGSYSNPGQTAGNTVQQNLLEQQRQNERAAEARAVEEAERKAADERHAEAVRNHQLALQRQREHEQRMEQQRQQQLQQNRLQFNRDAQAADAAKQQVDELQQINMNHRNIEQMEQEYAEKMRQLNYALNNMEQANQQKWNSAVDSKDWGTESYSDEMSELMKTTGAFVNSLGEAKRAREARESLAWQREQFLRQVEAEKAQMRFNMRTEMLKSFDPFEVPSKTNTPTSVFGFYIGYNFKELSAERGALSVSNIAEIGTYDDGTWPSSLHFRLLEESLSQHFEHSYFHSTGYRTYAEAAQMRQALVNLFSNDGTVNEFSTDATINPSSERMDFWESSIVPGK